MKESGMSFDTRRAGFARGPVLLVAASLIGVGAWLLLREERPSQARVAPDAATAAPEAAPAEVRTTEPAAVEPGGRELAPTQPADAREALDAKLLRVHGALAAWADAYGGSYPTTLDALVTPDANGRRHLTNDDIVDPWGRRLVYVAPSNRSPYQLHSFGRDGVPGGTGDDADRFIADLVPR